MVDKCLRCGKCCNYIYVDKEYKKIKKCRYLRKRYDGNGTYCTMYTKRIFMLSIGENLIIDTVTVKHPKGYLIKKPVICMDREQMNKNYPGCPYNKKGLEMFTGELE